MSLKLSKEWSNNVSSMRHKMAFKFTSSLVLESFKSSYVENGTFLTSFFNHYDLKCLGF